MHTGLTQQAACLLAIDWQERLFVAMPEKLRDSALRQAENLLWMARTLQMPLWVTEQYPKGLGPSLPQLEVTQAFAKTTFSAWADPDFRAAFTQGARHQVMVTGMETHICVAQSVRDLLAAGHEVWVVADACLSRHRLGWQLGLERMRGDGAKIVTAEAAMFELLGEAGGPVFKELSRRIR